MDLANSDKRKPLKRATINVYTRATCVNQNSPGKTKTNSYPNYY